MSGETRTSVTTNEKLLLIDVYALVYRAFFALPPLNTSSGQPVNAAYGFQRMLQRVLNDEKPTHVVACFDAGIPAERFEAVPEYKANRSETPADLRPQFALVRRILEAYGIPIIEVQDEEADDCIATIVTQATARRLDSAVVSGDLDLLQLVNEHCTVVVTRRGISEMARYDAAAVHERYGLRPEQLPDFRGLKGDPSDNLPGVPGIGEKTAAKLIAQFGSLDALLANVDSVSPQRIAELLRAHADKARSCRDVSLAKRDLPIELLWDRWRFEPPSAERMAQLYSDLEFKSLLSRLSTPAFAGAAGDSEMGAALSMPAAAFQPGSYQAVLEAATLAGALDKARTASLVSVALVPQPASWRNAEVAGIALSYAEREAIVFPVSLLADQTIRTRFADLLQSTTARKIVHDAKNISGWLVPNGFSLQGLDLDLKLAAGLLDPSRGEPSLPESLRGTPGEGADLTALPPSGQSSLFEQPPEVTPQWATAADAVLRAAPHLTTSIRDVGMERVLFDIEQPLAPILAEMEAAGFRLDLAELERISESLSEVIASTSAEIYRLAGEEFNLNSPKALGAILFEKLGLPSGAKKKTGYGTGVEVLAPLAVEHEIAAKLLQYREVSKLKSTYVDSLPTLVDARTGLLHTTLHQLGAATGRLSSTNPNLQNIPVRSDVGRAIRRAFLPATPGNLLMAADYSQIELRLFAHMSADEEFIAAFARGDDIHAYTAQAVFGTGNGMTTPEMRRRAKAVNFGILYGISDFGLAQSAGMERAEAKVFIADYLARFPTVKQYIDRSVEQARNHGFVTTLFGRRRYLPDLRARAYPLRAAAERMAINAPIQGSAADLIKLAMVRVVRRLREIKSVARLVLQVHDELIFDVAPASVAQLRAEVKDAMENAVQLSVPLAVDLKAGPNWAQAEAME
ncbi:MAG: DNA polymerase I [Candidatus Eremiobacter antarcticus]|nr:DNA polymerase I [Candidatus Eremiobacteraeota bacterium]MBC5808325.1 DNA polymerase I [Candidatus Eremiobacteraeota bacterium]PZR63693.1 MAG: DNA polymerase I [Candidatus Eremiobacter sp. RRmetagenome_bin22]